MRTQNDLKADEQQMSGGSFSATSQYQRLPGVSIGRRVGKGGSKGAVAPLVFLYCSTPSFLWLYQWHTFFLTAPLYLSLFQLTCVLVVLSPCNSRD